MPVATNDTLIYQVREARDAVKEAIEDSPDLELGFVGVDDEKRLPEYPAVVVSAGNKSKELHATHTFAVSLRCLIWVYHARMDVGHRQRSDEDLMLVEKIEQVLETDPTFNDRFIFSYVESTEPGVHQPRSEKSDLIIGTRMMWVAASQQVF